MEKMTKKDCFTMLLTIDEVAGNEALVKFITHELELLAKKNAARKSELTETQKENLVLANDILDFISIHDNVSMSAIGKAFGKSSQKVTPIVKKLEAEGKIHSKLEKRVYYYSYGSAEAPTSADAE